MNIGVFGVEIMKSFARKFNESKPEAKQKRDKSLCFGGLLEGGVGLVDLVIPGLLGLGELESLEIVERSSRSSSDDALVEGVLLPLFVDLGRGPRLANGAGTSTVGDGHLVLEQTHVLESHRLAGDALTYSRFDGCKRSKQYWLRNI